MHELRSVAVAVATAVALQAQHDGVAEHCSELELAARIGAQIWEPVYRPYRRIAPRANR